MEPGKEPGKEPGNLEGTMGEGQPDFTTVEGLMSALYHAISGPPGGQNFVLFRAACHPDLRMVRTRLDEAGRPVALSMSADDYEANARRLLAGTSFYALA